MTVGNSVLLSAYQSFMLNIIGLNWSTTRNVGSTLYANHIIGLLYDILWNDIYWLKGIDIFAFFVEVHLWNVNYLTISCLSLNINTEKIYSIQYTKHISIFLLFCLFSITEKISQTKCEMNVTDEKPKLFIYISILI